MKRKTANFTLIERLACQGEAHRAKRSMKRFTLIELLVVIIIIMILAGMLIPVMSQSRKRGYLTKCRSNMYQFGVALSSYRGDYDNSMPGWLSNLVPEYGVSRDLLICPQDYSLGHDGGRPHKNGEADLDDEYTAEDYGIEYDSSKGVFDFYTETDDTEFNTDVMMMPRNTQIKRCSYMYEFAGVECSWTYPDLPDDSSWNEVKEHQLRNGTGVNGSFQPHLFPSVRCFYHWGVMWGKKEYVMNTAYEGTTFPSLAEWENGVYEGN